MRADEEYDAAEAFWAPCEFCHAVKPVVWKDGPAGRLLLCKPCRTVTDSKATEFDEPSPLFVAGLFLFLFALGGLLGAVAHFVR